MTYESAFVSRATAKAIARLYQAEGNDSFIYKAGEKKDPKTGRSTPWFKVELGRPGTLDAQLPGIEWYPSAGTRPARAEELPTPMPRGPAGEYLPIPRVELEKGEKAGPKYGASYGFVDLREDEILTAVDEELRRSGGLLDHDAFSEVGETLDRFLRKHCDLDKPYTKRADIGTFPKRDIDIADDAKAPVTCQLLAEVRVVMRKIPTELHEEVSWYKRALEGEYREAALAGRQD